MLRPPQFMCSRAILVLFLALLHLETHQEELGQEEALQAERETWWVAGHTQLNVWDHSWLTPRLVCGLRFMRVPLGSSLEGGIFVPISDMGMGSHEVVAAANSSGAVPPAPPPTNEPPLMLWTFDGTAFQNRAIEYYEGIAKPPMEDVWMLMLIAAVPVTKKNNVLSGSHVLELQCSAVALLASHMYAEYMAPLVPPAVLLKYFKHSWEVHSRAGVVETATEMLQHYDNFVPMQASRQRFQQALEVRREAFLCVASTAGKRNCPDASHPGADRSDGVPVTRPLVDVVVARCKEDLQWIVDWLGRVLRDEWTPEVPGLRLRLLIYERCRAEESPAGPLTGKALVDRLLRLGVISPGSLALSLPEPLGFENVAYVHYCKTPSWRDADFAIFLHGLPFDHLNSQVLDDVLRSMTLGTYGVPFVHLNNKRAPRMAMEPCLQELIRPALTAWQEAKRSETAAAPDAAAELPFDMSTYCCSQFVVARHRLDRVADVFWSSVWDSLHDRVSVNGTAVEGLDASCRLSAKRIYQSHHRHGHNPVADYGLWAVVLERAWHWLFGEQAVLPARELDARLPLFLRAPRARPDTEGGPRGAMVDRVSLPDWGFDPGFWGLPPIIGNVTQEATTFSMSPVPTRHFARSGRVNWRLPDWVAAWFEEDR